MHVKLSCFDIVQLECV